MMKKLIIAMLLTACLTWTAAIAAESNSTRSSYSELISGRYDMMPRSIWLKEGMTSKYSQVLYFVEASGLSGAQDSSVNAPIKSPKDWESLRKASLATLASAGLLPTKYSHSSHPREFYFPKDWNRSLQQQTTFRTGKSFSRYCNAKITIIALRHKGSVEGDLKWWDEIVIQLPKGTGC